MRARLAAVLLLLSIAFPGWSQAPDPRPVILAFGDSMTAGYGVPADMSYPAQLQKILDERGYKYRVVNMGVSRWYWRDEVWPVETMFTSGLRTSTTSL